MYVFTLMFPLITCIQLLTFFLYVESENFIICHIHLMIIKSGLVLVQFLLDVPIVVFSYGLHHARATDYTTFVKE